MKRLRWGQWSLAVKLTITMTVMLVIVVASVTSLSIYREQQTFRVEMQQQADLLLATLAAAAVDPLYTLDADALSDMVEQLGAQALSADRQILSFGRVYDADGRIIADAYDPTLSFGLATDPFGQQLVNSETTVFKWEPEQLIAGRAVTVGPQRLGAVSVGLPTAPLEAKLTMVRSQGLTVAAVTIIIGTVLALAFSRSITDPLQALVQVTQRIASGDLSHKIEVPEGDEVAALGQAMEQMRAELQMLYVDLERQVVERTHDLRKTEARFRRVVSSISDHIYMTEITPGGEHLNRYVSPNVEDLTGYPVEKFVEDWNFWPTKVIYPEDRAAAKAQAARLISGQNSQLEYRLVRANGEVIWVRDSGRVEKDDTSQSTVIFGVVSDITHLKQTQEILARARDQALKANEFKTRLLANVSHDLRTPLGGILGYAEMLQFGIYGALSDRQTEVIQKVIHSVQHLTTMVNQLLDQARLESDTLTLANKSFKPQNLVERIQASMEILAEKKGLQFSAEIDKDIPPILHGDVDRLEQILNNLIGNAIKFTEQGSVKLHIFLADETHWALQVSDTGLGIPAEAQSYIFDPFQQVDGSLTRKYSGSGLGLTIVNELTILMGGKVELESKPGQGSCFTVLLPLTPIQEAAL